MGLGRRDWVWGALYGGNGIILTPGILLEERKAPLIYTTLGLRNFVCRLLWDCSMTNSQRSVNTRDAAVTTTDRAQLYTTVLPVEYAHGHNVCYVTTIRFCV